MSDLDRFVVFVRREAASYHAPPRTPSDTMWTRVSAQMDAAAYNEPPPAPREEMWERIEAAWGSGQSVGSAAAPTRDGGRLPARWTRKRIGAGWAAGLAAAASLVLGLMLGRSYEGPGAGVTNGPPAGPAAVTTPGRIAPPAVVGQETATVDPRESTHAVVVADAATSESVVTREPARAEVPGRVAPNALAETPVAQPVETDARTTTPAAFARLVQPAADYETTRHLGRAAMLLTAFRIDQGTPTSQQDLARWARELLGDTRMYLDMEASRSPVERALLEDLELVLLQISRLGPGAPDFEWQLALESMEWKGTLTRLRAASTTGET